MEDPARPKPEAPLSDESRYRLLVEAVTDYALYMLDATGRVTSWNPGAQRFKGYAAAEIIGQHFSRFYTDEDRAAGVPARALATAEREGKFEAEGWRVRKDGSCFWAHVVIDPIRAPDGHLIGFAKITRDLTERRQAEEALRRSQEQFRLLVQGVTDYAIYMLDTEGRITSWNAGAQRIKGYTADEILGQHFSRFYRPEDQALGQPAKALAAAAREGRYESEGWRVRKDGSPFWANVVIDPLRDDHGQIVGFAKVTRDVTAKREAQLALEKAQEALFQSQKLDALGQLSGGVAHDFNNLLMVILSSLELLRKRVGPGAGLGSLIDNAVQATRRGAALTQRMLSFARRQALKPQALDLATLVAGMSELLRRSLGPTVQIDIRLPPGLAAVRADENQLELALLNLAVNARDAMPRGGRLTLSAGEEQVGEGHPRLAPGTYVRLAVSDTGVGMDEATLARATEPFFTTKDVGQGTGLGLSMVDGLAGQSGGQLRLTSRPGQGTTVELWLPAATADDRANTPADEPAPSPQVTALTVLAVDDDALVLANTVAMLEDLGHRVLAEGSATAALQRLQAEPDVQVLVTDHAMPQMTGAQLAGAVRDRHPALPVVLATGYAELAADLPPGVVTLTKPFGQGELAEAIAASVDAAGAA